MLKICVSHIWSHNYTPVLMLGAGELIGVEYLYSQTGKVLCIEKMKLYRKTGLINRTSDM